MIILDGIIVLNKEKNYTSNDVVQIVKKTLKEKTGHTGTLDPMATGVLPILIGKGTLLSKYIINHDKIYIAKMKLGIKTDTGDITGNIIEKKDVSIECLNKERIEKTLIDITGEIQQIPPMYSAIKVNGKKLYEYARKGQKIQLEPRLIKIYKAELISILEEEKEIEFRVECSKGTYIRTLCEMIAEKLGTIGTMTELTREKVGDFELEKSITIGELKENFKNEKFLNKYVINIEEFFSSREKILLSPRSFVAFINGVKLFTDNQDGIYRIYDSNQNFVGIGTVNNGILKRDIVI